MEEIKLYYSLYFKDCMEYLISSPILIFFICLIEYANLILNIIDQCLQIFNNGRYMQGSNALSRIILNVSPYFHFYKCIQSLPELDIILFIIYTAFFILFLIKVFIIQSKKTIFNEENANKNRFGVIFNEIYINFYEHFFFRVFSFFIFDIISRMIIKRAIQNKKTVTSIIILLLLILYLILIIIIHMNHFLKISIYFNFNMIECPFNKYPYDYTFCSIYEIIFTLIKFLIVSNKNYLYLNNFYVDYIALFLICLSIFLFYVFVLYYVYQFFLTENILYILPTSAFRIRLYFCLLAAESILLRVILNQEEHYKNYLMYQVIFILFDGFLIIEIFPEFIYGVATKSNNYLGVCWYLEVNKIDVNKFILEWIPQHKINCTIYDCEICQDLGDSNKDQDFYNAINNYLNCNNNFSDKNNIKKTGEITEINKKIKEDKIIQNYSHYKFIAKLLKICSRSISHLSKEDLIRLDFLRLCELFLSNQNKEFLLSTKICQLMIHYHEHLSVFVSLFSFYNTVRKNTVKNLRGYEIFKKSEEFGNNLREFINDYQNFIRITDKSPMNYIEFSKKFYNFKKNLIIIQSLFKKNIDCNYQLLIYRYAYENLLSFKKDHINVNYLDLSIYNEFLDYHYNNDKIFVIQYTYNDDSFRITKASKECLKYQDKCFDLIFPSYLRSHAISLFLLKLNKEETKKNKNIFEFIINNMNQNELLQFVESFKMKYSVCPTFAINKILMPCNYIYNYIGILIFEEKEDKESLVSFSSSFSKYLGITPNVIDILNKNGYAISLSDLFEKKNEKINNTNNDFSFEKASSSQDKVENLNVNNNYNNILYTFSYQKYNKIYNFILDKCEGIIDLPNYQQIFQKRNNFHEYVEANKELKFLIDEKFSIVNRTNTYKIYTIREVKRKSKNNQLLKETVTKTDGENSLAEDIDSDFEVENIYSGNDLKFGYSIISSVSSTSSKGNQSQNRNKKDDKKENQIISSKELNKFTYIFLIFGLCLLVITIIFLIVEIKENNYFLSTFQLFMKFRSFKQGIQSSTLGIVSNFKIWYKENNNEFSENFYKKYSNKLNNNSVPVNTIIAGEISRRYASTIEIFLEYRKEIYSLNFRNLEKVNAITVKSNKLNVGVDEIKLIKEDSDFNNLCREFSNYITSLLTNNSYTYLGEDFSLMNYNKNPVKENEYLITYYNKDKLNKNTKIMDLLVLSYPSLQVGFIKTTELLQEDIRNSINRIEMLLITFFSLLMILHLCFIVLCIIFLYNFVNVLKANLLISSNYFKDSNYLKHIIKRIELIKILSYLYSENPIKINERLEANEDTYKNKNKNKTVIKNTLINNNLINKNSMPEGTLILPGKQKKIEENKENNELVYEENNKNSNNEFHHNMENPDNCNFPNSPKNTKKSLDINDKERNENENEINNNLGKNSLEDDSLALLTKVAKHKKPSFDQVIFTSKIIMIICFSIYFIINIIIAVVVFKRKINIDYLLDYCKFNDKIDDCSYNNIISLIYLVFTNSTFNDYAKWIYNNSEMNYSRYTSDELQSAVIKKEYLENKYKNLFPPLNKKLNLNCSEIIIEDENFKSVIEYLGEDYKKYFTRLCKKFPIISSGNDKNLYLEISYKTEYLGEIYQKENDFLEVIQFLKLDKLYELYTLISTFFKIIRIHFNQIILAEEASKIFENFKSLMYIYLIICVVFEILLFFIINFWILVALQKTNKLLTNFIQSLDFN